MGVLWCPEHDGEVRFPNNGRIRSRDGRLEDFWRTAAARPGRQIYLLSDATNLPPSPLARHSTRVEDHLQLLPDLCILIIVDYHADKSDASSRRADAGLGEADAGQVEPMPARKEPMPARGELRVNFEV
ncbi:unnamed protein product [Nippostrongylus brasiliensis]|uniref:FCP1 homology domain-containing protein n=1 Tax=Nippostrongylus brasiliensis TaxID=27835 RepID=A0A0N4Y500_NIPBR|nr:unnamed protein product [Nippostrongylus brasiliensis]